MAGELVEDIVVVGVIGGAALVALMVGWYELFGGGSWINKFVNGANTFLCAFGNLIDPSFCDNKPDPNAPIKAQNFCWFLKNGKIYIDDSVVEFFENFPWGAWVNLPMWEKEQLIGDWAYNCGLTDDPGKFIYQGGII